jgi:Mlc titration factor MtfA (ptsG expression regulator)
MAIIGLLFLLFFPIWGLWIIFSLSVSNTLITPGNLYRRIKHHIHFTKNKDEFHNVLYARLTYYQKLDNEQQKRFLKRVKTFIAGKEFIPVELTEVSPVDKVLIASSAVQLTFGLDEFVLSRFTLIYIYPKHFYNKKAKNHHKGEVNVRGSISLSLHDFHLGNQNDKDGINLGLHEMAHALKVEQFLEQDTDDFFNVYYAKVSLEMDEEMESEDNNHFIREYGKTNKNEFFAVCVENFFERPLKFKTLMPELYDHFVLLLNQDPLQISYTITENRSVEIESIDFNESNGVLKIEKGTTFNFVYLGVSIFYALVASSKFQYAFIVPLLVSLSYVVGYKKIYIYDKGIVVKRWYSRKLTYYPFSGILLVLLPEYDITKFMIKYKSSSKIISKMIDIKLNSEEKEQLLLLLKSNQIGVKYVGGFK